MNGTCTYVKNTKVQKNAQLGFIFVFCAHQPEDDLLGPSNDRVVYDSMLQQAMFIMNFSVYGAHISVIPEHSSTNVYLLINVCIL